MTQTKKAPPISIDEHIFMSNALSQSEDTPQ